MMGNDLSKSICDFSFGMLFMSQVLYIVVMYAKGRYHRLQRMMFWFMLYLFAISVFEIFFFYFSDNNPNSLTSCLTDILETTVVPCALVIIIRLTHPRQNLGWIILFNALFYGLGLLTFGLTESREVYDFLLVFTLCYSLFIIVYGFVAVRQFNKLLADNFSDDKLSLYWLKYIVYLYIGIIGIWTFATVVSTAYSVAFYNVFVTFAFGMFCYFVYRQEDMLESLELMERCGDGQECRNQKGKSLAFSKDYDFADRFEKVFSEKEAYLKPTLNINDLASAVGTNRTYVSNYINQQLHTTFYAYVNQWRVVRAKELLASTTLPLEEVASQSGFNSLSSFRRYFAGSVGMTPSAYRTRVDKTARRAGRDRPVKACVKAEG